ncbi:DUF692 domain-containing protein [Niveibacterium umoris]|uniref:Uncharacterized protein n=1 Tax=Niveibacterium umoris TaxID=1193620 RepID=A0A840BJA2_9RHOO|nr:DUF692 domain-containing protein [Niveibacterium umoris]MBB4011678.1 hypothetical protein [Niveibacterium umoris]
MSATPPIGACPTPASLPVGAGIGLKAQHFADARNAPTQPAFFEVHAENHLGAGGPSHRMLEWVRRDHGLSIHGVGLSIGGPGPLDREHLARIAQLVARHQPDAFSEHLAWSSHGGEFFNDLLPLPYNRATLERVCAHVVQVQDALGRAILLENPSTYVEFASSSFSEADFISEVVKRTGCGLLLDVTNFHVSCTNHARDPWACIQAMPLEAVGEIHLAGFAPDSDDAGAPLLIDAHDRAVVAEVWSLYHRVLDRIGPTPTLIEWDNDLPAYSRLLDEAAVIKRCLAPASHPQEAAA